MSDNPFADFESFTGPHRGGDDHDFQLNDLEDPIPTGLPIPATYRMFVMPVGIKTALRVKTDDGDKFIHMPDQAIDAELWLNCLGKVCALGPACFAHPRYKELGLERKDFPNVGSIILYSARSPLRFTFKGTRILVINDDHWFANVVDPSTAGSFKFYI
jgi:hypothetical protein